ncbi:MAG: hypothetical protein R3F43_02235 [bacterium]
MAELRPSAITDVGAALHQAAAQRADGGFRRRLLGVVAEAAAGDPGPWLRRAGVEDAQGAIAAFFERVEEAFFFVAAPDVALARARQAMENLRRWDAVLARLHGRLLARRDGEEAAQAVVARFLEPRIIAAYAPLPPDELERVALTAGRNLTLSTLAGPRETTLDDAPPLADDTPDVDERLATREQWRRLFTALRDVVDDGVLTAQELLFLWLAPALGAGEAWRVSGGDLARVASANYHHTRCMGLLHGRVGADSPWVRPPNPGRPDDRTRGLVGLLALRDGPDPYLEAAAGLPADARAQAPPPTDPELLTLLWLFNLGPDAYRGALPASWTVGPAGPLVARCLRLQRWEEARRGALARTLAAAGGADGEAPGSLDARSGGLPARHHGPRPAQRGQPRARRRRGGRPLGAGGARLARRRRPGPPGLPGPAGERVARPGALDAAPGVRSSARRVCASTCGASAHDRPRRADGLALRRRARPDGRRHRLP